MPDTFAGCAFHHHKEASRQFLNPIGVAIAHGILRSELLADAQRMGIRQKVIVGSLLIHTSRCNQAASGSGALNPRIPEDPPTWAQRKILMQSAPGPANHRSISVGVNAPGIAKILPAAAQGKRAS